MQKISIVVVEYNSLSEISDCISSIKAKLDNVEIIVSSNSNYSTEKQIEITNKFLDVKWLFNERNGGFAYAMNRGLERSSGELKVIMNPDVSINNIDGMISYLDQNPNVGAIAPRIVDENGVVQDSFRKVITPFNFILRHIKRVMFRDSLTYDYSLTNNTPIDVDWLIGAFIMVRKAVYDNIGGLDENYFLYCEDMDWCTRVRLDGYRVVYYPDSSIKYVGTRSARSSKKYTKIFLQSLFYYWKKF